MIFFVYGFRSYFPCKQDLTRHPTACYNAAELKGLVFFMSYYEFIIKVTGPSRDTLIQRLTDAGCLGVVEQDDTITAYFPETVDIETITKDLSLLKALFEKSDKVQDLSFSRTLIPEQDWNESWKKGFTPLDVGERFTVLPPWEKKREGRINLVIDPGMAFGTGHHETTRSCLVLMEKYAGTRAKERFLDLGTGTGLLAIAASRLGYRHIAAIDTDPLAVDAARTNSALNQIDGLEIREGSIADLNETFDFIAANIISGVLVQLAPALAAHLKPGGIAVLSGILAGQENEVVEAMLQAGLKLLEQYRDGKWISLAIGH
jgi:ribosomal protein L11 methyltransferase